MPDISVFDSVDSIDHPESMPLAVYLDEVKNGRWEDMTLNIRQIGDKKRRDTMKKYLPSVTFSGLFSKRKDDCLIQHSGVICIDIDDLNEDTDSIKELLISDRYVYSCFTSVSGNGLRVLFRINGAKHRESYYGISDYLRRIYGLITDPQSMVPSRSFYVTYDPFLYISKNHVPMFTDYPKEKPVQKPENFAYAEDDFKKIIDQISQRKINLCEDYQDWLKIGFAFADKFGEDGREYYHLISSMSEKYNQAQCDKQYRYCVKHKLSFRKVATIATFYWYCKQAGVQITSERTQKVRKMVITGKSAGLRKEQIIENIKKFENIDGVDQLVSDIFDSTIEGAPGESLLDQLEIYINNNYILKRNEITRYIERFPDKTSLQQKDFNTIFVAAKKVLKGIDYQLMDRLILSDFIPTYNPLIEFFESLGGTWNNIPLGASSQENNKFESPLIDKLAKTIENDNPSYTAYFLRKWLVSVVSAAFKIHSPLVFVLLGRQNTGKTEWFRRLLPSDIKRYYAESKLDAGKDDDILMTQKLIIMDDEMSGKSKREIDRLKELTSKQYFSLREPYGRSNVDLLRIAVLCGTSNFEEVLSDPTGNRRIIPVTAWNINKELYNTIDKKELMKEAYELFNAGFDWRIISKQDIDYLNINDNRYEIISLEGQLIEKYFMPSEHEYMTASEIKVDLEFLTNQRLILDRLGKQMKKLGFSQKSIYNERTKNNAMKWGVAKINRIQTTTDISYIKPDTSSGQPF